MFKNVLAIIRPQQWLKNCFVFLPVFFYGRLFDITYLMPNIVAFSAFCFASSAIYCFNDICDAKYDRTHPIKSQRPIASGEISPKWGYVISAVCTVISLCLCFLLCQWGKAIILASILSGYLLINIAYSLLLKHIAIVDVLIIATGFVLRIFAGAVSVGIFVTHWIVLMTFLLALFLAFAKRREDVIIYEKTGNVMRKNILKYNLSFINEVITAIIAIIMVCYIMYTVSPEVVERFRTPYLYITSFFVLAGLIRYLQLTIVEQRSGNPTKIAYNDLFVQLCIGGWFLTFLLIIYL